MPCADRQMIEQLGTVFADYPRAAILVLGDTITASAAAQAGSYTGSPVVYVEAACGPSTVPGELNRCVIGVLADLHCAPAERTAACLPAEVIPAGRIVLTGNPIV